MSRRPIVAMLVATSHRRDVGRDVPLLRRWSRRSRDLCFRIIKSTEDLIFGIIEGRTDKEKRTKQQQLERSKRLCFCIPLLKTINDI